MKIGEKIRNRRKSLGMTQEQCAKKYGCKIARWCDLECDRKSPSVDTLERIVRVLKCKVRDLL